MYFGMRFGNPLGSVVAQNIYAALDPDAPGARVLSWVPERSSGVVSHVMVDQGEVGQTAGTEWPDIPQDARDHIELIETSTQNADEDVSRWASSPSDRVTLTWDEVAGTPNRYEIFRKVQGGSYPSDPMAVLIAGQASYSYVDGPIDDDAVYVYKVVVYDAAGNSGDSNEPTATIAAAPDAPSGLALTMDGATLTLDWTASPSGDVKHYAVYRGDPVELSAAVFDTDVTPPWTDDMTGLTNHYEYLVRTVDDDDQEEANLSEMAVVDVSNGAQVVIPNEPQILAAFAIESGEVRLRVLYDRTGETGVATTVRLYTNNGAGGAMDWVNQVGTVDLKSGLDMQFVDVDSSGLTGGLTYLCGVRARTDAGVTDANTNTESVTTDDTAPTGAALTATVT